MSFLDGYLGSGLSATLQAEQEYRYRLQMALAQRSEPFNAAAIFGNFDRSANTTQTLPDVKFDQLKKSVEQIEAEPFESGARKRIEGKIGRLQKAGATAQALILEAELTTRDMLIRLKEWDYKLLTKKTIKKFESDNTMTLTRDGLKVHIDPIEKYCGNPQVGEAKDRIIPDNILDSLETAKERELFDEYAILWAEKVKDPLLLGIVHGCEDYFFIAEWGTDITFEQITKGE